MRRKFTDKLINWAKNSSFLPLMVVGARQTGKTYIIEEFCKKHFKQYIYMNLDVEKSIRAVFEDTFEPSEIIRRIELILSQKIDRNEAILFIDEIQVSEYAVRSLKYFAESSSGYRVVCAGSLLGVKLNRFKSSFPVGKVIIHTLYPMDFEEFLWAAGKQMWADEIRNCFDKMSANIVHEQLLTQYKNYLCIGGLPACVRDFTEMEADFLQYSDTNIKSIITSYIADMGKYTTSNAETVKIEAVYNSIPKQLGREDRKFRYSIVASGGNKAKYESAIEWLTSSGMILRSTLLDKIEIPLKPFENPGVFKLYCSDTGILTVLSEMRYRDILLDTNTMFRGTLAENFVAVHLRSSGYPLRYWSSGNTAEVDFIINNADGIIPIEVKAGTSTQSKSLNLYMEKYEPPYGIRLSQKNFGYEKRIKSLPLYAAFCI